MDWTPERITALRNKRGQSIAAFGRDLYSVRVIARESARVSAARLESGDVNPSACVVRALERMEKGEI